jgi:hypothetical protein
MSSTRSAAPPSERVRVDLERGFPEPRVRLAVERYDEAQGWCLVNSISLPLNHLPLLEQALEELRRGSPTAEPPDRKIIPFPGFHRSGGGHDHAVSR